MNVVGDQAFNLYLNAEPEKPSPRPLNRAQIAADVLRRVSRFASSKCFCSADSAPPPPVPTEGRHVAETLVCSLDGANAEHIMSLTQNYLVEELALSEVCLKSFCAFLANTRRCFAEKARIRSALNEQLRLHPSCAEHMVPRYRHLMLTPDPDFSDLRVVEYVVFKLEQLVSLDNEVRIGATRTSRRRRQPVRQADESPVKRPKQTEVHVDSDPEEMVAAGTAGPSAKSLATAEPSAKPPATAGAKPPDEDHSANIENLLTLLEHLVDILRHDLGYTLRRAEPVHTSILGGLVFGEADVSQGVRPLNHKLVTGICEVLKNAQIEAIVQGMCELLQLVGDTCALAQAQDQSDGSYDVETPGPCRVLINEFCACVIREKPQLKQAFPVVLNLGPTWLRYHAVHYLVEKVFCRKVSPGLAGIVSLFGSIHRSVRERVMDTSKVLKSVSGNQRNYSKMVTAEVKKPAKSESNSDAAYEAVGKHSAANSEVKSEIGAGDEDGIDYHIRQKLSPFMVHLLFVFIDSTITEIKLAGLFDHYRMAEDSNNLQNVLTELCGEKNIPIEFNLLRRKLNKIL